MASPDAPSGSTSLAYGIGPYVERAVERIERYLREPGSGEAFVVGVFGEWGSGKSTVLREIRGHYLNLPPPAAGDAAAALSAVTLRLQPQVGTSGVERLRARIRRIVVDDEVALVAELDDDLRPGQVNPLLLRRRNGAVWNVRAVAGRALPDDALLQPWVARIAGDATLADIGGSAHATFNTDSTLLRADNPD